MKCMKQRTIKFRGWFPEMKRMLYQDGDWCNCLEYATWSFPMCIDEGDEKRWNVNEECILMQFTGLFDKNGKEIYEGDVVRSKGNPRLLVARFDEHYGAFIFENQNNHIDCEIVGLNNRHGDNGELIEREVIGNVWENPELMKS